MVPALSEELQAAAEEQQAHRQVRYNTEIDACMLWAG
jgi:hypothetical protein